MFANVLHAQNNLHRTFTTIVNFWNLLTGYELVRCLNITFLEKLFTHHLKEMQQDPLPDFASHQDAF